MRKLSKVQEDEAVRRIALGDEVEVMKPFKPLYSHMSDQSCSWFSKDNMVSNIKYFKQMHHYE